MRKYSEALLVMVVDPSLFAYNSILQMIAPSYVPITLHVHFTDDETKLAEKNLEWSQKNLQVTLERPVDDAEESEPPRKRVAREQVKFIMLPITRLLHQQNCK